MSDSDPAFNTVRRAKDGSVSSDRPDSATDPGRGRRLGLDVGAVRIGVAVSDPDGILASPVETVEAAVDGSDAERVAEIAKENFVVEIVVGLPVALRGNHTASTEAAIDFYEELVDLMPDIPHRLVDERMSTMAATRALQASGVNAKKGRKRIDQAAAVHILQGWLDSRRRVIS